MQYFIVADVHSFYNEMMQALKGAGWEDREDQCFVSLGDLCDRGPDTVKVLEFVNNLPDNRKILIKGNHEELLENAIIRRVFLLHDIHNGTVKTAEAIALHDGISMKEFGLSESDDMEILSAVDRSSLWNDYVSKTVDFAEVGKNIFVHGWIPCKQSLKEDEWGTKIYPSYEKQSNWRSPNADWRGARWMNGMQAWLDGAKIRGKTIWCGHWHASWGHSVIHHDGVEFPHVKGDVAHFSPFIDNGIVAMDACTAFSHKVNCIMIEEP